VLPVVAAGGCARTLLYFRAVRFTALFVGGLGIIPVVTFGDVTREGVLAAVGEFDRVGRDEFLKSTESGPDPVYFSSSTWLTCVRPGRGACGVVQEWP
jgi:hypothetical protein